MSKLFINKLNPYYLFFSFFFCFATLNIQASENVLKSTEIKTLRKQWQINRQLVDKLDALKIEPKLNLYSKLNLVQIQTYKNWDIELGQQIDYIDTLPLKTQQELSLQQLQLRIAKSLNSALFLRLEHNYFTALTKINETIDLINSYENNIDGSFYKGFKSTQDYKCSAFYQKGKIHRMLAGMDEERLDNAHLKECEANYLTCLELAPYNPAIHSSLAFLYNNMGQHEEALKHHKLAHQLHPLYPEYIHGLALGYYHLEKEKADLGTPLDFSILSKAEEHFEHAILLFNEFQRENSRVFLDQGKLKLFLEKTEEALSAFNNGLLLEPSHPLLLLERGLLFEKLNRHREAFIDFQKGCIVSNANALMHAKYLKAFKNANSSSTSLEQGHTTAPFKNQLFIDDPLDRIAFEKALIECSNYIKKIAKSDKKPTCFISYAWNIPEHEKWVEQFAEDLEKAGFNVLLDRWVTRKGQDILDFVEKILTETDYILVIGSKLFLDKYQFQATQENEAERVVRFETRLINYLIGFNQLQSNKVIPLLIEGTVQESIPPLMRCKNIGDFTKQNYCQLMFEIIRDMHKIDQRDEYFRQLMENCY